MTKCFSCYIIYVVMKMNNNILEKIICLSNKISQNNKSANRYDTNHVLYTSEIHMIEAIDNYKNVNASKLAATMGITNGAVNQVAKKLIKKGLIEPYKMDDNKKDIYYRLTNQGQVANLAHSNYHKQQYIHIEQFVDSLSSEKIATITDFLSELIDSWPSN